MSEELQKALDSLDNVAKFADTYGIPLQTIYAWKSGKRNPPPYFEKAIIETIYNYNYNKLKRGDK